MPKFDWGGQVHKRVTEHALTETERSLRNSASYIIDNLNLVTLALRLCDFKDVSVAVEAKHVSCPVRTLYATLGTSVPWG